MAVFDPSRLYVSLLNTGLQQKDNPLYQVIHDLIGVALGINSRVNVLSSSGGTAGPQGIQGIQGLPGADADIIEGIDGVQGPIGLTGPQGIPGLSGLDGDSVDEPLIISPVDYTFPILLGFRGPLGTIFVEDALGVLSVKAALNQTNIFLYNTFTDNSNYERAFVGWSGNTLFFTTNIAGTGVARNMLIGTNSLGNLDFRTNGVSRWEMTAASGHIIAFTDNVQDIGAAGANRPRVIYAGTNIITPFVIVDAVKGTAGTLDFYTSGVARWELSTGTWLAFADNTYDIGAAGANRPRTGYFGTSIVIPVISPTTTLIGLSGTTSSFPGIKRVSTTAAFRLADDSADCPVSHAAYTHSGPEIDTTYQIYTPLTATTVTMSAGQSRAIINPAGLIAALTITLPPSPVDGQVTGISFTQAVTVLTVNAPGGATVVASPTSAAIDTNLRFLYQASSTSWFPAS